MNCPGPFRISARERGRRRRSPFVFAWSGSAHADSTETTQHVTGETVRQVLRAAFLLVSMAHGKM